MPHPLRAPVLAATLLAIAAAAPPALQGQHEHHAASAHAPGPRARAQLDSLRAATRPLSTPEAARAAGYRPMFGNVPLQGEHYVRVDLVLGGAFDLARPSVLMFAPVAGTPTLVGAAYAFMHPNDAPPPAGFDAAGDVWHAHERLASVPGKRLLMMHAWLVDAPDGAFARYNPWLPYLAVGLGRPAAALLADSAAGLEARRLGLALAAAATPPMLFEVLERQRGEALRERTAGPRAAILALVPRMVAAERAGDRSERARLAAEAVAHGERLVAAYRDAAPDRPVVRTLVERTVDEFMGRGHGVEDALGELFGGRARRGDASRP